MFFFAHAQPVKVIAECTITFTINVENGTGDAIKMLYIKGRKTRSDMVSPAFHQTTIYDNNTGEAIIMKDIGGEKYLTKLNATKWKEKNAEWNGMTLKLTTETKMVAGYSCKKAVATTKDGKSFIVYYTTGMVASASENPYQFKNIPGLVLEYESQTAEGKHITFKAIKINFSPVPAAKFIIPDTGYREL